MVAANLLLFDFAYAINAGRYVMIVFFFSLRGCCMKRFLLFAGFLVMVAALIPTATAYAGTAAHCIADPTHGRPGTIFTFVCSGFSPNTLVNVWSVDPSGVAQSGQESAGAPESIKTDEQGVARFSWASPAHETGWYFAAELGNWLWYVNQLCNGKACIVGSAGIHIDSGGEGVSGANLAVTPNPVYLSHNQIGYVTFGINGSGFAPYENVNLWLTQPAMCDRSAFAYSMSAIDLGTAKADRSGSFSTATAFSVYNCVGNYTITARALGSGRGAEAAFALRGNSGTGTFGDTNTLVVSPDHVAADLGLFTPAFTVSGPGFEANEPISCRTTRPDSRGSFPFFGKANGDGILNVTASGFAVDSYWPNYSAQVGVWRVTCHGDKSGVTQFGQFTVVGGVVDP